MAPRVSIIVPNYNHAPFLKERINSILSQTFTDYELIILDDCSSDESRLVIEEFAHHPQVSAVIFNSQNSKSTFRQWNKGLELAKGQLVWIAESDDIADPKFLELAVSHFEKHSQIGIYECQSFWIDALGKLLYPDPQPVAPQLFSGKAFILDKMLLGNAIHNASAVVFKKSLVELPLPTDITNFRYCGDWLFWVKLLAKADIYVDGNFHNYFRRHDNNVSGNAEKNGLAFLEGIQVYGAIRKMFRSSFLNPIRKSDRTWASSLLFSTLSEDIKERFLKASRKVNPFISLLYRYYQLKKASS